MNAHKERLTVVIPAFNEAKNLELLLPRYKEVIAALEEQNIDGELIVVDDGSGDETAAVCRRFGVPVLRHPFNLGYSGALQSGFSYALRRNSDLLLTADADGQHLPEEIPRLVDEFRQRGCDLLIGSRFVEETGYRQGFLRSVGMRLFSEVIRLLTHRRIYDVTSGFRLYNARAVRLLAADFPQDYPEYVTLIALCRAGCSVEELPVTMKQRLSGTSMHNALSSLVYPFKNLMTILVVLLRTLRGMEKGTP